MSATLGAERVISEIFDDFEAAVSALDASRVASFYEYPCILNVPGATLGFDEPAKLIEATISVFDQYRRHGVAALAIGTLSWNTLSTEFLKAEVCWVLSDADGREVVSFNSSYVLRRHDEAWKICYEVSMEQAEKFAALSAV